MLDAAALEQRDVAAGEDPAVPCASTPIRRDPAADAEQPGLRLGADRHEQGVEGEELPTLQLHEAGSDPAKPYAEVDGHASRPPVVREHAADLSAGDTPERSRLRFEERDLRPEPDRGRRDLGAHEPCSDDDQPAARADRGSQGDCVPERPQHRDAGDVEARQPSRASPGGEDEGGPFELPPGHERHATSQVEALDGVPEPEVDAAVAPRAGGPQEQLAATATPGKEFFAEGGALVRGEAFGSDHGDRAPETTGAQRLGASCAGEAGTDDDDAAHAACLPVWPSSTVMAPMGHDAAASSTLSSVLSTTRSVARPSSSRAITSGASLTQLPKPLHSERSILTMYVLMRVALLVLWRSS